jgi:DNA sulfur modification protein DndD
MRLDRLVLENVRQYAGRHQLSFAKGQERNVTLIQGLNGAGKTHLLEGLRWCLYGLTSGEDSRDLVAKGALAGKQPGDEFETAVSLFFDHGGRTYEARRAIRVRVGSPLPEGGGMSYAATELGLTLFELTAAGAKEVSAPREEIRSILPQNAADYFFFDGEKIDKFARPDNASGIRDAVNQVLKLVNLDRAIEHLGAVAGDYETRLRQLTRGSQLPHLLDAKQERDTERASLNESLVERDAELAKAKDARAQIEAELSRLSDAQALMAKRQGLSARLEQLLEQDRSLVARLERLVAQAPIVLSHRAVFQTVQFAEGKRKRGEIPSRVRQVVVNDLLSERRCICGRELAPGTESHETVAALGKRVVASELEERLVSAAVGFPAILSMSESIHGEIREALGERSSTTS